MLTTLETETASLHWTEGCLLQTKGSIPLPDECQELLEHLATQIPERAPNSQAGARNFLELD